MLSDAGKSRILALSPMRRLRRFGSALLRNCALDRIAEVSAADTRCSARTAVNDFAGVLRLLEGYGDCILLQPVEEGGVFHVCF